VELQKVERLARLCDSCQKMCRHVCTTHLVTCSEADTPNERCSIAYRALNRGKFLPVEAPYMYEKCAVCGLCQAWCETDIDAGEVMLAARADLVTQGLAPGAAVAVHDSVTRLANPFGEPVENRYKGISFDLNKLPEKADVLYFAGCNALYRQPEIVNDVLSLLSRVKVDLTILKESDVCCGKPLYLLGYLDSYRQNAARVLELIEGSGARRVVFTCPGCLRHLREVYQKFDRGVSGIELLHISEFLLELVNNGDIHFTKGIEKRITYHDPCDLGRRLEIYEQPRQLLMALPGVEFKELQFNRRDARCCGSGGGLGYTNPGLVVEASRKVVGLAQDIQAEVLVTACATCKKTFLRHTKALGAPMTIDIAELALSAL